MTKRAGFGSRLTVCAATAAMVWLGLAGVAAAQAREGSFERTLKAQGAVDISVRSGAGSIRVVPGAGDSIRVVAKLRADGSWLGSGDVEERIRRIEQNPPVEQQGNVVRIGFFQDEQLARNIAISYDVTVPAAAKVQAHTGSGSIEVGAVKGAVEAKSGSGSVRVEGAATLDAAAGSGSIHASAVAGVAKLSTGSGSITVTQTGPGDLTARAGSGSITATGVNGAVRIDSGSGSIRVDGRPAGAWSIHCGSGGVSLTLPADAAFDLDARTNSGTIDSDHPVTMTVTGAISKRHVRGKVRGGGPLVEVSAASGSIRLR